MRLAVIGVNHKTAPVALRERLSFGSDMPQAITQLSSQVAGCAIVSTCNRSELYVGITDNSAADEMMADDDVVQTMPANLHAVAQWLAQFKGVAFDEIAPYLYTYQDSRALNHWLRVAAGLDSMILGEPQILGQIRQAVAISREHGGVDREFGWLTQQVFAAARTVRRDTKLGEQAVTLGFATAKLATQIFDNPSELSFLLVAAGEMNRLVAHNVAALGVKKIIIANRSPARAEALADELQAMATAAGRQLQLQLATLEQLPEILPQADIVSSCSGSMQTLIDVAMVKQALKIRRHQPMLLVDLAVPRDIESAVGELDDVYLYSVDDLQHVIAGNMAERQQAAVEAELLVGQLVAEIEAQMQVQLARSHIHNYRQMAQDYTDSLLSEAMAQLEQGQDAKAVLEQFAHRVSRTLMHSPSRLIRRSAQYGDNKVLEMVSHELLHSHRQSKSSQ
ncbi:glutamyl-tRNA reductase [Moraxella cuniculi DSM 21768]|uniref:Glutamyl-tRNA reductase n=1 Tax=Moraxella cuniculi DSM 21768 TaxID=1122245 RepID=A0A1N7EBS5_9GAMM|nr:glutamyl-tRNA reductase [Moraxella cuniculi]OOS05377.1 glutamyl-tRNA reductase [Moraxella cuniculi]SIR85459.1 glutamyl-tRNA reductase [Moraxella cuniculi DSM 21768]